MDRAATPEDRGGDADAQPAGPEEAVMWWIVGFVALCAVVAVVIARRGPGTGADYSADPRRHDPMSGNHPGGNIGDGGAGA